MSQVSIGIRDYSNEVGRASFTLAIASTDTAADLDAMSTDLQAAVNPVTLGVISNVSFAYVPFESEAIPTDPFAQRELGLRILYTGNSSNRNFSVTIPAPDLDALTLLGNTDEVDLEDASVMADLVAWIEANVDYPHGDPPGVETVTVRRAYIVGRNN